LRDYSPAARSYELMTIFTPEVGDDQVLDQLETVTGYVRTAGGTVYQISHEAPWGRRRFAYPIRHNGRDVRDGFYSVIQFDLVPGQVSELERDLKLDERVLRHMITVYEAPPIKAGGEGEEGAEPATPTERTEIAAGDLLRNAAAAREAEEAQRQAAAAQQAAQQAAAQQNAPTQQQPAPAATPTAETAPATDTGAAAGAPAGEGAAANAASAEVAEATDTTDAVASDHVPAAGTEISEAASSAPVTGATGEEIPAAADPVSGEGTASATDSTPSEDATER
jgi:small subunit ribosomal protein S6